MIAPISIVDVVDTRTQASVRLLMQHLHVSGELTPFGAGLLVRHVFRPDLAGTAELVYAFMLPRDAAQLGFRVVGEGFRVDGELKPAKKAVEEYEAGVAKGSLSVLARTYRDGMVNLSVGQIRPGETIAVWIRLAAGVEAQESGLRFRFPFTLSPVYHPSMLYEQTPNGITATAPEDVFGDILLPEWRTAAEGVHTVSFTLTVNAPGRLRRLVSPSHALETAMRTPDQYRVVSADHDTFPNRDLVIEAEWDDVAPFAWAASDGEKTRFAALVPGACMKANHPSEPAARRIVLLIDRSGSMEGVNIAQARNAVHACLSGLMPEDLVGMVAFSNAAEVFLPRLCRVDAETLPSMRRSVDRVQAGGGTELGKALEAATSMLGEQPGEILLITDGQVGDTPPLIELAIKSGHRVHTLGIGAASQDRFLCLLSRSSGGLNTMLTSDERVDRAAAELFARGRAPLLRGLALSCGHPGLTIDPALPAYAHAGQSMSVMGSLPGDADTALSLSWTGAAEPVSIPLRSAGAPRVRWLTGWQGARLTTDLESVPAKDGVIGARARSRELARLAREYQVANTEWAWVAVVSRTGDAENTLPKTRVIPTNLPRDNPHMDVMFSRRAGASAVFCKPTPPVYSPSVPTGPSSLRHARKFFGLLKEKSPKPPKSATQRIATPDDSDTVFRLLALVQPDGGLPGQSPIERLWHTLALLDRLLRDRRRTGTPAFDPQIERLSLFLQGHQEEAAGEAGLKLALRLVLEPAAMKPDFDTRRKLDEAWERAARFRTTD